MQVSIQSSEGLERRLTVKVPAERIEKEIQDRLKSLARRAKIDGFRPGKVPFTVVQRKYGQQVRFEVQDEVVRSSFQEAVMQQQLRPAGNPRIEANSAEPGQGLEYTAVFEIYPEVTQVSLDSITLAKPVVEIGDADVNAVIERLRKQRNEWQDTAGAAQEGDRVIIDFVGTLVDPLVGGEGQPFAGNEGNQVPVVLGSKSFIDGFEAQLIGVKAGEERVLEVRFPDQYHAKDLAGKTARFAVKVATVAVPQLPELDDEFARSFGIGEGGVDALRTEVKNNMQREAEQAIKRKVKQQVLEGLLKANPLTLPQALVDSEIGQLMQQAKDDMEARGGGSGSINLQPAMFEEHARRRVALGLILAEIIRQNGFKAQPERVRAMIESAAASYEDPAEVLRWYYANRERMAGVEAVVLEDQAVEWIAGKSQVNEVPTSFDELIKAAQD
jgi:trigger factor